MARKEFRPRRVLETLVAHDVDFVLIGGLAGVARGSSQATYDVDVAYARDASNLERLAAALRELGATLRGAPRTSPFSSTRRRSREARTSRSTRLSGASTS